ncbi:uncharacterized protein L3040_007414 [Drepanopeziza brunnea f. sp. 'multigermtubi']|uniref:Acetylserotonin methytransferase-like protein n=1 Tax=Marssonina brunnea f. sp. multigermtubi (strain MB_m1) TaxID=1072389 RepID=K1X044_MARBU|nr:acetylserotonin methytransferase-like protein [Drepanopeziza brunnea f. sp. 'multigermtubi' MB_m1]EKD18566.1 acetylserotonin methytransferase-like protein [Drepanopeziza brunnea f. sp. 'multigermtubi' MB_m1]KAJ5037237.1 hypothetical protein L3040_007414 [Drepanopeziza brunnea f. sp. 'multigermtubi']
MPADHHQVNMGLKLFPPPPRDKTNANPSRKPSLRHQQESTIAVAPAMATSGMDARPSALGVETMSTATAAPNGNANAHGNINGRQTPQHDSAPPITTPPPAHLIGEIPRSHTSFSEAPTLVRSNSNASSNSKTASRSPQRGEPAIMRSIFPRYNPHIALEHQAYFPTQKSPTHILPTNINRRPYSPSLSEERSITSLQSPRPIGLPNQAPGRFPRGVQDETILETSSNGELKELWKVVNGWRVSSSEGRRFCLKMTSDPEEPTHTLSSTTQPFYTLRLVPTSTSAQMTMLRHDPNKPPIGAGSPKLASSKIKPVMSTTLEETARRLPPNDGLVALLYPRAASDMVIELANKPNRADSEQVIAAAERECGRLVWDEDSGKYYLVHPAISTPFVVSIHSSPAWSRVEYTLEHAELPHDIVRLVRDGSGSGFLEIDTAVAARIDCFYVVDVVICAIMLVGVMEEKKSNVERFEAPSIAPMSSPSRHSLSWPVKGMKDKEKKGKREVKMEEFELDLESQDSVKAKKEKKQKEKVPGCLGLIWMLIKFLVWMTTMSVKALAKIIIFISRCLTKSEKSAV